MTTTERVEHLEDMMERLLAIEERSMEIHTDTRAQLAEQREDSKKLQRLWVNLAKKHGWLDDEDIL